MQDETYTDTETEDEPRLAPEAQRWAELLRRGEMAGVL
jgi:hypothetical protein